MKLVRLPGSFPLVCAILAASGSASLHAQSTAPCTISVSYSPFNPVVGQPVTLSVTVQTSVPLTDTNIFNGLLSYDVRPMSPGEGDAISQQKAVYTPGTVTITASPDGPGPWEFFAAFNPLYVYGTGDVCGSGVSSQPVILSVAPPAPISEVGSLKGQYSFLMQGAAAGTTALSNKFAIVGSFTADGNGNITGGLEDTNSAAGANTALPLTGAYTLDSTGHGTLTLKTSLGVEHAGFFVPLAQLGDYYSPVEHASLISTDAGAAASGYLSYAAGAVMPDPSNFLLTMQGDSACNVQCGGGFPVFASGLVTFAGGVSTADLIGAAPTFALPNAIRTGTFSSVDPVTGRFTYTLAGSASSPQTPTNFVGYVWDYQQPNFYTISLDPHSYYYLLSGTGYTQ